jgi:hypothetical protein
MMDIVQIILVLLCLPIAAAVSAPCFADSVSFDRLHGANARREEYDRLILVGEDLSSDYAMGRVSEEEYKQSSARLAEQLARVAEDR